MRTLGLVLATVLLIACEGASPSRPLSPNGLLDRINGQGVDVSHYQGTALHKLRVVSNPHTYMKGTITIGGSLDATATLHKHRWMAEASCEPVELCFCVEEWSVRPYSTDSLTEAQRSLWADTQTKMQ